MMQVETVHSLMLKPAKTTEKTVMLSMGWLWHAGAWSFFAALILLGISSAENLDKSIAITAAIIGPSIPAVYLNLWLVNRFWRPRKWLPYLAGVLPIVVVFGWLIEFLAENVIFGNDPSAQVASYPVVFIVLIVSTSMKLLFEGETAKTRLAQLEAGQTKAELDFLKSQVNPHFLFNSLNNIYGLVMEDPNRAGDSILTLSSLLRYLIYASPEQEIPVTKEIQFIEDYLAMERLRLGEKCEISMGKKGDPRSHKIPPFLFVPFVENAFKHGSYSTARDSFVDVQFDFSVPNRIRLTVKNSLKTNVVDDVITETPGHGIANVRRRLDLAFSEKYALDITREKGLFEVNLTLSLN